MNTNPDNAAFDSDDWNLMFQSIGFLVLRFDGNGKCISAKGMGALADDLAPCEMIGAGFDDLFSYSDRAYAPSWLSEMEKKGQVNHAPVILRHGGRDHPLVACARQGQFDGATQDKAAGPGAGVHMILRNESAAEAERRELSFLPEIARRTNNIVVVTDEDQNLVWANSAFEKRTGYSLEEARGQRPADLVQFEGTDRDTLARIRAALSRNEPVKAEILNRSKTGEEYWLELDIQPLLAADGSLRGYMDVQTDITVRKALIEKAEEASRRAEARAKELTESRRKLRDAVEALPHAFAMYDREGTLVLFNENYRKFAEDIGQEFALGDQFESIIRRVAESGFVVVDGDPETWVQERLKGFEEPMEEYFFRSNSGKWFQAINKRTPDGGHIALRYDISDLKEAEDRIASIIQSAGVGTYRWDAKTGRNEINAIWAEMLGYSLNDFPNMLLDDFHALIHPEDRAHTKAVWEKLERGETDDNENLFRIRHKDGGWVRILSRGQVTKRDAEGRPQIVSGVHIDVTEHKAREDALERALREKEEAERRFHDISAVSDDWFWEQDEQLRYTWHSENFYRLLGVDTESFVGKTRNDLYENDPRVRDAADWGWLEEKITNREPFRNFNFPYYRGEAKLPIWVRISGAPVFDSEGEFRGYQGIGSDVTPLLEARDRAEEANRTKSLFLANMSHEIRTPLNGVLGMAELLEQQMQDPSKRQMVRTIRESGETLLAILNDLLDMSKIEAGRLELEYLPFRPADVLESLENLHGLKAEEKGLSFELLSGSGARLPRLGDPTRVRQILNNLLNNAIKFTEDGEVVAKLTARKGAPVEIEVSDSGVGMCDDQKARLFKDFSQADATISRRFGGTGLGMAIVKRLVDMMNGKIEVESELGVGTRITVVLPLEESEDISDTPTPETQTSDSLVGIRVLAADDNKVNRDLLREILTRRGAEVTLANNGAQAVEAWAPGRFDIAVLDISMPVMDGIQALAQMREAAKQNGADPIPAIAFTANAMSHQVVEYVEAGFDGHVAKPFKAEEMVRAITALVASDV